MKQPLLILFALFLSFSVSAQKKQPPLKPPEPIEPPRISMPDNGLSGTLWRLAVDTSGDRTILKFHRMDKTTIATVQVHFIDARRFRLNVQTKSSMLRAEGTYEINPPETASAEDIVMLVPPSNLYFKQYNNQAPAIETLKRKIGNSYMVTQFETDDFKLEEQPGPVMAAPGQ
ncbi:hypothetical protein [Taibaiella koreensis]|uniref:hypothetical protein n=1 Tax=Taibaiella koreensis TaxID=1268548 RepID=UPI000E5A0101|nr:hypothetical protein [Taibaiella koreensis]